MNGKFSWKNVAVVVTVVVPLVGLYIPTMFRSESNEERIDEIERTRYTRCVENNKGKEAVNRVVGVLGESLNAAIQRDRSTGTPAAMESAQKLQEQRDKLIPAPLLDCGQEPTPR